MCLIPISAFSVLCLNSLCHSIIVQCGENGHFANRCPKGALSFLSNKGPQAAAAAAAHHAERGAAAAAAAAGGNSGEGS